MKEKKEVIKYPLELLKLCKVKQTYVDEPENPKTISAERFIELTEGKDYYKKNTALRALRTGTVRTPFAYFDLIELTESTIQWNIDYHLDKLQLYSLQLELLNKTKEDEDTHS